MEQNKEIENMESKKIVKRGRPFKNSTSTPVWTPNSEHVKNYFTEYYANYKEKMYKKVKCEGCNKEYQLASKTKHDKTNYHINHTKINHLLSILSINNINLEEK